MKRDLWPPNLKMPNNMAPLCGPFLFSGPPNWGDFSLWPPSSKNSKILQIQFWHFFLKILVSGKNVEKKPTLMSMLRLISAKNIICYF